MMNHFIWRNKEVVRNLIKVIDILTKHYMLLIKSRYYPIILSYQCINNIIKLTWITDNV